jgi:hypothetical protein
MSTVIDINVTPTIQEVTINTVDNVTVINVNTEISGSQTLQQTMELGRSYIQTVGGYQYLFRFLTSLMQLQISNPTTQIGGILEFTDSNAEFSFSDALNGIASGITADLTDGVTVTTSDDSTSENFVNQLKVPIKTSESGISSFYIPNNKPAGEYDLLASDGNDLLLQANVNWKIGDYLNDQLAFIEGDASSETIYYKASKNNNWKFALAECHYLLGFYLKAALAFSDTLEKVNITTDQWWERIANPKNILEFI